jgi:hypothetical protein
MAEAIGAGGRVMARRVWNWFSRRAALPGDGVTVGEALAALRALVATARPSFRRTPYRDALDQAAALIQRCDRLQKEAA